MLGEGHEPAPPIQAGGTLVKRIDKNKRRGDLCGLSEGTEKRVEEDKATKAPSLVVPVHGEASEQRRGDRVIGTFDSTWG